MEIQSTLLVLGASAVNATEGVTQGQSLRPMIGNAQYPTDRLRVALANYEPNTLEQLHWHPIEACYFVVSGSAIVRDINNKEYTVGPGTIIYCPPGIAGAHEWEVKDKMQLLSLHRIRQETAIHRRQENPALVHRSGRPRQARCHQLQVALLIPGKPS
jgi:mannose-6-phosphate isomerase-like protein (cupin superfamily)